MSNNRSIITLIKISLEKWRQLLNKQEITIKWRLYGLEFNNTPQSKEMRGTFQVNLCLIYAYRFRCNEGVYLNSTYKQGEGAGVETVIPIDSWGVMKHHLPFMYGANFPPSMQSALMQQLGPAALLIGLAETTSAAFQGKWESAVVRDS